MNLKAEAVSTLTPTIDSVTLGSPSVVRFTVKDSAGRGAVGLQGGSSGQVRFSLAKLMPSPGTGDPTYWQSLINRSRTFDAGTTLGVIAYTQATSDRGTLVDNQDGSYVYTFATDVTNAVDPATDAGIAYEPTRTHRIVMQISGTLNGNALPAVNAVKDFVPAGGDVTERRDIIETKSCNECHGKIVAHGSRYESGYCVVCHNTGTKYPIVQADGGLYPFAPLDMSHMVHAIHSAATREKLGGLPFNIAGHDYSEVTYPQDIKHCRKCHEASTAAPQGDNWKSTPNKNSCSGCHDSDFFQSHVAGQDNSQCATCHGPSSAVALCGPTDNASCKIEDLHRTVNPTQNNPVLPPGVSKIDYEIARVTQVTDGGTQLDIKFRILRDGQPISLFPDAGYPADLSGAPSFLIAYGLPQEGHATSPDYNNASNGVSAAQPIAVSVWNLALSITADGGTLSGPEDGGYYVGTPWFPLPAAAKMRAVTLQGYYTQKAVPGLGDVARHTISVVKAVEGDVMRRQVVDSAKCANCHEWFEAHGGNRVYEVQACVMCHNPNLTSSGRAAAAGAPDGGAAAATLAGWGVNPGDPLTWPEESQNLREMIHSIHGAHARANPFRFVRDFRGAINPYDFSHATYPNDLTNCEACHKPGTYSTNLPDGGTTLSGTRQTLGAANTRADILAARADAGFSDFDIVTSPTAAACGSCHDGVHAKNHMRLNGAYVDGPRSGLLAGNRETCDVCHGAGRSQDSALVHKP